MDPKTAQVDELVRRRWQDMSPRLKLEKIAKLSDFAVEVAKQGLRDRNPDLDEASFQRLFLEMRKQWRNSNY